jgi:type I restriction enzyme S subunit
MIKRARLGDHVDILSGFAFDSEFFGDSGEIPVARIRDVVRGHSETFYRGDYDAKYIIDDGDLLIGMDGEFNRAYWCGGKALLNQRVCRVRASNGQLDERYLFYFLPDALKAIEDLTPFVTVKHLSVKQIREIQIPLPPLTEQRRIAGILDKAEALRAKRRAALAKIDILPQAIFLELFGDNATDNSMRLEDFADLKRGPFGGALKKEIFVEAGYKVYEQKNAIQNDFTIGSYFISERKYREMEAFAIAPDDLIVSCSGTLGRVAIVPHDTAPGVINQALLRIRPREVNATPVFLKHALEQPKVQAKLVGFSRGTGLQNFPPMSEVRALRIPAADLATQREFARRVEAVEKLKAAQRASLAKLDALFASLQHRAFRGDL